MKRFWTQLRSDLPGLALLAPLLMVVSSSVAIAEWTEGLWLLSTIAMLALVVGYLLATSSFSDFTVVLFATVYGLFAVWLIVASLLPESFTLRQRTFELALRLVTWVEQALEGGFSRDNLIFVLLLGALFWMLGVNAAVNIFRSQHLWPATIPPGLALLINTYYYFGRARMDLALITYLFLTFTLAVRTNTVIREKLWRSKRVIFTPGIRFDLLRGGVLAGAALIAIAWSAPAAAASNRLSSAWDRSVNPWHRVQDTFQRLFGGVEGSSALTADYYGGTFLSMGGPVNLGNTTVMYVYAPEGHHYYWRSKVFDQYDDGRWSASVDQRIQSDFGVLNSEEDVVYALRRNVQQRFEIAIPATRLVYAAPQPVSFASLTLSYDVSYTTPGQEFAVVSTVQARDLVRAGEGYAAISSVSVADQTSLRSAGTDYPAWVRERYLDVPTSITARTHELAASLAAPHDNSYDVARAMESYLRDNIEYDESVPPPPRDAEPVDYLLFESRKGYCNYYASALVIMLRTQGIPARVAAGFGQGTHDPELGAYRVLESDAHAWVEVYFPGYGWVEFEPTSSEAPIIRPETRPLPAAAEGQSPGREESAIEDDTLAEEDKETLMGDRESGAEAGPGSLRALLRSLRVPALVSWVLGLALVAALATIGVWLWFEQYGLGGLSEVSRCYARLNAYAPWVGADLEASATPFERAVRLAEVTPEGEDLIDRITALYVQERYGRPPATPMHADKANVRARLAWQKLRPIFVRAALERRLAQLNPFRRA